MPLLRWLPLAIVALAAFWLRTHDLARRPMHADEANQAVKLGELLDTGKYAFDPRDHHGPTLYYAGVPAAWFRGERSLAALSETTVRLVPAVCGTLAVVLLGILAAPLGRWPALAAAAFLALSPPAVYFSRYFIQETLLATFTLAAFFCAQRWWVTGLNRWAVLGGGCVGLMQATKASAPLFLSAATIAFFSTRERQRVDTETTADGSTRWRSQLRALGSAGVTALATAALLYSAFLTHPGGIRDALGAYGHALARFGNEAAPTGHEKPWWYYLRMFGWYREGGLVWHQAAFTALAIAGAAIALLRGSRLQRAVLIYTVLIVAAFSGFAYKTPWHAVHFVPGLAILATLALASLAQLHTGRLVAVAFFLIVVATLFQQTWRTSFLRPADQRNPYAYVHSSGDVVKFRALAEAALDRAPDRPVRVIAEEYWPLPWYFRGLPRVGFWSTPPAECDGALVITSTSLAESVRGRLHGNYRESFLGLRPGVVCIVFTPEL